MNGQNVIAKRHQPRVIQPVDVDAGDCQCPCHTTGNEDHCGVCCDTCPTCGRMVVRVNGPRHYLPEHCVRIVTSADRLSGDFPPKCQGASMEYPEIVIRPATDMHDGATLGEEELDLSRNDSE